MEYLLYILAFILIIGSQIFVKASYQKYKKITNYKKTTGLEIATKFLEVNNIKNIKILPTTGTLSDHYDPTNQTVNLSKEIYEGTSIASIAVATHECGHVLQHAQNQFLLKLRSLLVPIVNFSTKIGYFVLLIGLFASIFNVLIIGLILIGTSLLFQLITLPIEFDASKKAIKFLEEYYFVDTAEKKQTKKMLFAAGMTYVASVAASALEILRLFLMFNRRR